MRTLCFVNPRSGRSRDDAELELERVLGQGSEVLTPPFGDPEELVKKLTQFERALIVGGDGTVSTLLPVLLKSGTPFGIVPRGTGNDLAREILTARGHRKLALVRQLDELTHAKIQPLSVWRFKPLDRPELQSALFCNYLSIGFDAHVVEQFASWRERTKFGRGSVWRNRVAYAMAGIRHLGSSYVKSGSLRDVEQERFRIERPIRSFLFANIRSIMGIGYSNNFGDSSDGKLEALVVRSFRDYASMICKGRIAKKSTLGSSVAWELSGLPESHCVQFDGEARSDLCSTAYRIEWAGAVKVLAR